MMELFLISSQTKRTPLKQLEKVRKMREKKTRMQTWQLDTDSDREESPSKGLLRPMSIGEKMQQMQTWTEKDWKNPLPVLTLQDNTEEQHGVTACTSDSSIQEPNMDNPTSHLQPNIGIKIDQLNDSTEGVYETELQIEVKESTVLDEIIYNTAIKVENKKSFQREDIDRESLEDHIQEKMSVY